MADDRRMFEMAKDQVIENGDYELVAGYYSPVSDQYKKAGLAKACLLYTSDAADE